MSDPALDAAQHALDQRPWFGYGQEEQLALIAAREALRPMRELHARFAEYANGPGDYRAGVSEVVRALAPLIYTSEELKK